MTDRFINWLTGKATDYLIWVHERECRNAPRCPDCELPEPNCYCDERVREDKMCEDAYTQGGMDAWEDARREFGEVNDF